MITSLPIFRGEPVYGGFMTYSQSEWSAIQKFDQSTDWRSHHFTGSYCHTTGMFFPRSLPFYGKYDDYGGIDVDSEWRNRLSIRVTTEMFENDIVLRNEEGKKYRLWRELSPPFDIDTLIKVSERGALHVKGFWTTLPVALWMVKAPVYEAMRDVARMRGSDKSREWQNDRLAEEMAFYLDAAENNWYDGDIMELRRKAFGVFMDQSLLRQSLGGEMAPEASCAAQFLTWCRKNKASVGDTKGLLDESFDFIDFCDAMCDGRYPFRPVCGAGSQNDNMEIQKVVAAVVMAAKNPYDEE